LSHRYYKLKAKWFGQKQLEYWDRNAPLPGDADRPYEWGQARELVLDAYGKFSPELAAIGKKFFDKGWIDAAVTPGKSPGAFAHPTVPSLHPYLLVNFQGKSRDVMTLAHELGHGVHQLLAAQQGALMADTPLTLAETASVFGEQLTFREMIRREKDDKRRKRLIAAKVEDMLNTVVRQVAFCEFEKRVHGERRTGELTSDRIGQIWMDVQTESLGPGLNLHGDYRHFWMYIPHFIHSPFYVYAYAFGDCLVNSLYAVYEKEKKRGSAAAFEKKYLAMLQAGGTLRHKELLAPFGLDATRPDFWQEGLNIIAGFIEELA
ncbi:MAG: oligoendopeptidase F, partial [Alphaproteobacteria bacterium]|nr:oligoendopeptidase F [Alphaproteobacteria bacterium]